MRTIALSPTLPCCGETLILDMKDQKMRIKMIGWIIFNEKPDETNLFKMWTTWKNKLNTENYQCMDLHQTYFTFLVHPVLSHPRQPPLPL